jgi:hypothetical protein
MTMVDIWGMEDGWKEIGKVHLLFCKRIMAMPSTATNGVCENWEEQVGRSP